MKKQCIIRKDGKKLSGLTCGSWGKVKVLNGNKVKSIKVFIPLGDID